VLMSVRSVRRSAGEATRLAARDLPWLAGAVAAGGVVAPLLLLAGLQTTPASPPSLLLHLEGIFPALFACYVFGENFDRRIAAGMALIVLGGILLSWQQGEFRFPIGSLAIAAACICWGIDNNLSQRVSANDPMKIAAIKGSVAGTINLAIAFSLGS